MEANEKKIKRKVLKYAGAAGALLLFAASWYATQEAARLCGYAPVLGRNIEHIYAPWQYFVWCFTPELAEAIPAILEAQEKWFYLALLLAIAIGVAVQKSMKTNTSHGSASWADAADIDAAGLGSCEEKSWKEKLLGVIPITKKERVLKKSGVVVGINPYTNKIMLHDGPEHILLMAPTRSGKGVNTIIPTGLIWQNSIFFFDVKKELWQATASYRRKALGQKVMKFEPLCPDGSTARWNPLAEIDFQTMREINDVSTIVEIMVRPDGEKKGGGDPFWENAAATLLKGVILHLLYAHYQEKKPLPCPTDIMSFLSSPDKSTEELFRFMKDYPHISPEEFLSDENILSRIYGEYVQDWREFNKWFGRFHKSPVHSVKAARDTILAFMDETRGSDKFAVPWDDPPFCALLTHPKVAECAANMLNGAEQTRASIMQTAQTALALYQNPVVQKNTAVSDFCIRDLLDPRQAVSMYLCMEVDDVATVKPLSRLFINTILSKLIRNMKFDLNKSAKGAGKQRLLLMLDEFPQLGNMQKIELALAVCAGYGIKMCIVSQDVNQLNKEYTKDNSIASNCHVHIYFTPNLDSGGATAKAISESLGKKTISTVSHSDGGGLFKGSNSTSYTGRELMTADEVARMSPEEEIVFIAGHKPVHGRKLRYYLFPWFTSRILPEPLYSDTCTAVTSYEQLARVHAAERREAEARAAEIREEKERMLLDSAQSEKTRAALAVKDAREALEALRKLETTEDTREKIEGAEKRLSLAEAEAMLADACCRVHEARLFVITLEYEIRKGNAKGNDASLKKQQEYADAKESLAKAILYEDLAKKCVGTCREKHEARKAWRDASEAFRTVQRKLHDARPEEEREALAAQLAKARETLDAQTVRMETAGDAWDKAQEAYQAAMQGKRQEAGGEKRDDDDGETVKPMGEGTSPQAGQGESGAFPAEPSDDGEAAFADGAWRPDSEEDEVGPDDEADYGDGDPTDDEEDDGGGIGEEYMEEGTEGHPEDNIPKSPEEANEQLQVMLVTPQGGAAETNESDAEDTDSDDTLNPEPVEEAEEAQDSPETENAHEIEESEERLMEFMMRQSARKETDLDALVAKCMEQEAKTAQAQEDHWRDGLRNEENEETADHTDV